jgi:hypothetical protein
MQPDKHLLLIPVIKNKVPSGFKILLLEKTEALHNTHETTQRVVNTFSAEITTG